MKKFIALALLVSSVGLISCSYIWTYNFLPDESYEQPDLKGWILTPDIENVVRVGRGEDSLLARKQRFVFDLGFELPNKKKVENLYDVTVEGASIRFFDLDIDKALSVSNSYYYSSPSDKEMNKSIDLVPADPAFKTKIGRRTLFIPLEVDSVLLSFDAVLKPGKYTKKISQGLKLIMDSIRVYENMKPLRVPVSMVLYKKSTKSGVIALIPDH